MMKHAFIISAHKDYDQIKLLLYTLQFGDVYLHIDAKAEELYQQLKIEYNDSKAIHVLENRIDVNWSGFSQVKATLLLLKAVKTSGNTYDYIHFISGQDLLLMNQFELDDFICKNGNGYEYINYEDIGKYFWRIKCYSFFRENKKNRTMFYRCIDIALRALQIPFFRRKNLKNYDLYKGSQWFSITQDCLEYILKMTEKDDLINDFRYTACPDEHFFQILLLNSKFKNKILNNNFRYIEFDKLQTSPVVLTKKDESKFMNGKYLFARKFDLNIDKNVILDIISMIQSHSEDIG